MLLNILFILCCLPIITIGASLTSLSYVTLKMNQNEETYIIKEFFSSFKSNFKQATILWLLFFFLNLFFAADLIILNHITIPFSIIFTYIIQLLCIFSFISMIYVFPLLAKFENSITGTLKNAFFIAIKHLPWTIVLLTLYLSPLILLMWNFSTIVHLLLLFCFIGFSLTAYLSSYIFHKIFSRYIH
ncbi:YesL family protein [Anaerosacchariphilus polymeriproducens]